MKIYELILTVQLLSFSPSFSGLPVPAGIFAEFGGCLPDFVLVGVSGCLSRGLKILRLALFGPSWAIGLYLCGGLARN